MGYDMTWQTDSDKAYFHLSVWGMSAYARAMHELGMVYEVAPTGAWPKASDHGTTHEHIDTVEDGNPEGIQITAVQEAAARAYLKLRDAHLSQHPGNTPGIPSFKFGTNDGWLVTPDECKAALAAYRAADEGKREAVLAAVRQPWNPGYWDEWIAFLEGAVDHGGFRVS